MKITLYVFLFLCVHFSFGQRTLIETGRPKPFMERNAQEIAGSKFKVSYAYVAFQNNPNQLDSINKINEETFIYLEKKHGSQWREKINQEIRDELARLNSFFEALLAQNVIEENNLVYFTKPRCGKKYRVNVYPNIEPENRSKDNLIKQVKVKEAGKLNGIKVYIK